MPQQDALRAIDATIHAAMVAVGLADSGQYQGSTGAAVPCRCYFDENQSDFGEDVAPVAGAKCVLGIFLADVPNPQRLATVTLGGQVWTLSKQVAIDQSMATWVVTRG